MQTEDRSGLPTSWIFCTTLGQVVHHLYELYNTRTGCTLLVRVVRPSNKTRTALVRVVQHSDKLYIACTSCTTLGQLCTSRTKIGQSRTEVVQYSANTIFSPVSCACAPCKKRQRLSRYRSTEFATQHYREAILCLPNPP